MALVLWAEWARAMWITRGTKNDEASYQGWKYRVYKEPVYKKWRALATILAIVEICLVAYVIF